MHLFEQRLEAAAELREKRANHEHAAWSLAVDMHEFNLKMRLLSGLKQHAQSCRRDRLNRLVLEPRPQNDKVGKFKEAMRDARDKEKHKLEALQEEDWKQTKLQDEQRKLLQVRRQQKELYEREFGQPELPPAGPDDAGESADLQEVPGRAEPADRDHSPADEVLPETAIPVPVCLEAQEPNPEPQRATPPSNPPKHTPPVKPPKPAPPVQFTQTTPMPARKSAASRNTEASLDCDPQSLRSSSKNPSRLSVSKQGSLQDFRDELQKRRDERERKLRELREREAAKKAEKRKAEEETRLAILAEAKRQEKEEQQKKLKRREAERKEREDKERRERDHLQLESEKERKAHLHFEASRKAAALRVMKRLFAESAGKLRSADRHWRKRVFDACFRPLVDEYRDRFKDMRRRIIEKEFLAEAHNRRRCKRVCFEAIRGELLEAAENEREVLQMVDRRRLSGLFQRWVSVKSKLRESNYFYEKQCRETVRRCRLKSVCSPVLRGWAEAAKDSKKERVIVKGKEEYMGKVYGWLAEFEAKKKSQEAADQNPQAAPKQARNPPRPED